jgi:hypothetical protein
MPEPTAVLAPTRGDDVDGGWQAVSILSRATTAAATSTRPTLLYDGCGPDVITAVTDALQFTVYDPNPGPNTLCEPPRGSGPRRWSPTPRRPPKPGPLRRHASGIAASAGPDSGRQGRGRKVSAGGVRFGPQVTDTAAPPVCREWGGSLLSPLRQARPQVRLPPLPCPVVPLPPRLLPAAIAAACTVLALTACGDSDQLPAHTPPPATTPAQVPFTIRAQFELRLGQFVWNTGQGCWGYFAYTDVRAGTTVTVADASGTTVAMGKLDQGQTVMDTDDPTRAQSCLWTVDVPAVPSGRAFYSVQIGDRSPQRFPEAELQQRVTLGPL